MADIIDQAQNLTEQLIRNRLSNHSPRTTPYSGTCLYCEEPVENARFCSSECRQDFEAETKRRTITGRHV